MILTTYFLGHFFGNLAAFLFGYLFGHIFAFILGNMVAFCFGNIFAFFYWDMFALGFGLIRPMPIWGGLLMADFLVFSIALLLVLGFTFFFIYSVAFFVIFSYILSFALLFIYSFIYSLAVIFCRFWLSRSFAFMNFVGWTGMGTAVGWTGMGTSMGWTVGWTGMGTAIGWTVGWTGMGTAVGWTGMRISSWSMNTRMCFGNSNGYNDDKDNLKIGSKLSYRIWMKLKQTKIWLNSLQKNSRSERENYLSIWWYICYVSLLKPTKNLYKWIDKHISPLFAKRNFS